MSSQETMRARLLVLGIMATTFAGCAEASEDLRASVLASQEAYCQSDVDRFLQYVGTHIYWGHEGPLDKDEVRQRARDAIDTPQPPNAWETECPPLDRFDFDHLRTLQPHEVEKEFNVTISNQISGYHPASSDIYVMVPRFPNPSIDDALQGFWRANGLRWQLVAFFD